MGDRQKLVFINPKLFKNPSLNTNPEPKETVDGKAETLEQKEIIERKSTYSISSVLPTPKLITLNDLNKLKAQMLKSKLTGNPNAEKLEQEYQLAQDTFDQQSSVETVPMVDSRGMINMSAIRVSGPQPAGPQPAASSSRVMGPDPGPNRKRKVGTS